MPEQILCSLLYSIVPEWTNDWFTACLCLPVEFQYISIVHVRVCELKDFDHAKAKEEGFLGALARYTTALSEDQCGSFGCAGGRQ